MNKVAKGVVAVIGGTIGAGIAMAAADKIAEIRSEHEREPAETLDDIADMTDDGESRLIRPISFLRARLFAMPMLTPLCDQAEVHERRLLRQSSFFSFYEMDPKNTP